MLETIEGASSDLVGKIIQGNKNKISWEIIKKVEKRPNATGGTFSVGYIAKNPEGREAFLKATDLQLLNQNSIKDPFHSITQAFKEQEFEREILDICNDKNMSKIVRALDYGHYETTEHGVRDYVFWIAFEIAKGDARSQALSDKKLDFHKSLIALHNLTVALHQLHTLKIAHNDVKPSNLLFFDEKLQKLADLARATNENKPGPWDNLIHAGDWTYAAPELLYDRSHQDRRVAFNIRQASDLYMLGSMGYFLFTGQVLTHVLCTLLRPEHHPFSWSGDYSEVLPYIEDAHGKSIQELKKVIHSNRHSDNIVEIIRQLTEPNPINRGYPTNTRKGLTKYNLQPYISKFDLTIKRLGF